MKKIQKAIILGTITFFVTSTALAATVDIKPSKTKPNISNLKPDPGCKYIVEYNEFMKEYSVNQICNSPFMNVTGTQPAPSVKKVQAAAPTYTQPITQYVPVQTTPIVNNYVTNTSYLPAYSPAVTWGFALPSFGSLFGGFSDIFAFDTVYDFGGSLPIFETDYLDFDFPDFVYEPADLFIDDSIYFAPANFVNDEITEGSTYINNDSITQGNVYGVEDSITQGSNYNINDSIFSGSNNFIEDSISQGSSYIFEE